MKQNVFFFILFFVAYFDNSLAIFKGQKNIPKAEISYNSSLRSKVESLVAQEKKILPDTKIKDQVCIDLVEKGAEFLIQKNLEIAIDQFIKINNWRRGEIFIFVLDDEGNIICHGDNNDLIWKNINKVPNSTGEPPFDLIKRVDTRGSWINFRWNNGLKKSYIKKVPLNNTNYYLGAGYFPQSKEYIAEQLVRGAIDYFKNVPSDVAFTRISNPNDVFVVGDISMFVFEKNGNSVANSYDQGYIGQNILDLKDSKGNYITKDIIKAVGKKSSAWVKNYWYNTVQNNYVEKIYDGRTKKEYYFVASYCLDIDELTAADLLDKAIKYIHEVGTNKAFEEFSNPLKGFIPGVLYLYVYDFKGNSLANTEYPVLVGKNLEGRKDKDGKLVVKSILELANKSGEGIVTTFDKNSSERLLFKVTDSDLGKIIVVAGAYVQNKILTIETLIDKAKLLFNTNPLPQIFNLFRNVRGEYYFGDIYLFVYNSEGIPLINGEYSNLILSNANQVKDDQGRKIVQNLIEFAEGGGGWYSYQTRNANRRVYVTPITIEDKVTKKKEKYILGSGYFS